MANADVNTDDSPTKDDRKCKQCNSIVAKLVSCDKCECAFQPACPKRHTSKCVNIINVSDEDKVDEVMPTTNPTADGMLWKSEESLKSQEEKDIKSLIEQIPTNKDALFAYQLDWSAIDNSLMEKKIRPWINKKIVEYIGEPEPTLVEFICSQVMDGSQAQEILEDVQIALAKEAEVFVLKMWRLLIYEVEAKKLGLV